MKEPTPPLPQIVVTLIGYAAASISAVYLVFLAFHTLFPDDGPYFVPTDYKHTPTEAEKRFRKYFQ
jgi:hypothetical protein